MIKNGVKSSSPLVQEKALQVVVSLCDEFYRYMPEYIPEILGLTATIVGQPRADEVRMQAIEVWCSIIDVELDLTDGNHNFMRRSGLKLTNILLKAMVFRDKVRENQRPS